MEMRFRLVGLGLAMVITLSTVIHAQDKNPPAKGNKGDVAGYKVTPGVSGAVKSVGSDTMVTVVTKWNEAFKALYPNVTTEVEDKGTSGAVPALTSGTANIGPMSRPFKTEEVNTFKTKFGYAPTQVAVCVDMVVIFVNKDCPLEKLTLQQVDAIFSSTRKLGGKKDLVTWGDLGLTGDWEAQPISIYGRNSSSGTYEFFKNEALGKGDFKSSVKEQPGSAGVVQAVGADKFAIGYSGIGYMSSEVKAVAIGKKNDEFIEAVAENGINGKYPLSRPLFLALNFKPGTKLDPLRREFLKFVLSKEGQAVAVDAKVLPVSPKKVAEGLEALGLK